MDDETKYFLLAMVYFAVFLIAGILVSKDYGTTVRLPVAGGIIATCFYFWSRYIRRG